jgi:hypothetical protein
MNTYIYASFRIHVACMHAAYVAYIWSTSVELERTNYRYKLEDHKAKVVRTQFNHNFQFIAGARPNLKNVSNISVRRGHYINFMHLKT